MADESKTEKDSKVNPGDYNRLVSHAKLQAIRLINTRYDMKPAALSDDREDWAYRVSNKLIDWHCDNDNLLLSGTWEYTASCQSGRKQMLKIVAKFMVTYRLSAICDEQAGQEFFERVGKFAAYPYFRTTFATLTQQSGITLHPLPIISDGPRWVTPPKQSDDDKKKKVRKRAKTNPKGD